MQGKKVLPSYAGITTFFRTPLKKIEEITPSDVVVAGIPFDTTGGARVGARFAPQAIRESSVHLRYYTESSPGNRLMNIDTGQFFAIPPVDTLFDIGDFQVYPADVQRTDAAIAESVAEAVERAKFLAIIGGDHYITFPAVRGFIEGLTRKRGRNLQDVRIGYIHLDGHFDLAGENYLFGENFHGSTARLIAGLPNVSLENMVWVGPKGYVREEQAKFIKENNLKYFTATLIKKTGIKEVVRQSLEIAARGTDAVYVSIDIDIVDVSEAPGASAIQFGGISAVDLMDAVHILKESKQVGAMDFVEVAPGYDSSGRTQRLAATALFDWLSAITADEGRV
jgi:agmatinase